MSRLVAGLAAAALFSVPAAAHAQFRVNRIENSGNGVNNTVVARNGPARGHFPGFAPAHGLPGGAGVGYGHPAGHVFGPEFRRNVILDSGNGIGNTVVAGNGGFGGGGYPFGPHGVFGPGGLNINVVTNSGNGVGNTVHTTNRGGPGGININVITNSGNGIGNTVRTRNR